MTDEPSARNAEKERREKNPNASRQDEPSDLGSSQVSDQLKADNDNRLADWPEDWRDQFWNAYPMRKNIKAAEVALVSVAKAGVKFESVLVAARRHGQEVSDRQFYKDPVKWMADEPWLDNAKARQQARRAQYSMAI